LCEKVNSLSL